MEEQRMVWPSPSRDPTPHRDMKSMYDVGEILTRFVSISLCSVFHMMSVSSLVSMYPHFGSGNKIRALKECAACIFLSVLNDDHHPSLSISRQPVHR